MTLDIHVPAGTTGHDRLSVDISAADAGWDFSGLRVAVLAAGESVRLETGGTELLVLPLAGGCRIEAGDRSYDLAGRDSVFTQITDYLYVPRNTVCTVTSEGGGRFAQPLLPFKADARRMRIEVMTATFALAVTIPDGIGERAIKRRFTLIFDGFGGVQLRSKSINTNNGPRKSHDAISCQIAALFSLPKDSKILLKNGRKSCKKWPEKRRGTH